MPTKDEFEELLNNCTFTRTTQNDVKGFLITSNKSGYEDKSIFMPTAGCKYDTNISSFGTWGYYWSRTLEDDGPVQAWNLFLEPSPGSPIIQGYMRQLGYNIRPVCPKEHEYVDLGMSVKWATCNVGATKPEEYGDYYAWGETEPKTIYDWSTYKWCNGSNTTLTKYNSSTSYGTVDNKTVLDPEDDVAHVKWGGSWRMPTKVELDELRNNCTWTWTTLNGVNGYLVTSNKTGYTDRSIFLPAADACYTSGPASLGFYGLYWLSSLNTDDPLYAWYIGFSSGNVSVYYRYRYSGFSVRPVCP